MTSPPTGPITTAQRRKLFAIAHEHGIDTDALRAMTPAGSISMLTVGQAATLIDALESGRPVDYATGPASRPPRGRRRPRGVYALATPAQRTLITALRGDLGWTDAALAAWLARRHFRDGRPMTRIDSSGDAADVIELLKCVRDRKEHYANR